MKKEKNEIIKGKGRKKGTGKTKRERKEARKEEREKGRKKKSLGRPTWPSTATARTAVPISISVCGIFNVHTIEHGKESGLELDSGEKNPLSHCGLEPASVLYKAFSVRRSIK